MGTPTCCMAGAAIMTGPGASWRLMRTRSSPSVISISPIPDSWTRSISFFSLRRSIGPRLLSRGLAKRPHRGCQRQLVSVRAQPADHPTGDVGEVRVLAEGLACVHVREVDFYEGDRRRGQRVAQGDAGVRISRRIDDDVGRFVAF